MGYVFDNSVQVGGRKPALWFVQRGRIDVFDGSDILGVVKVAGSRKVPGKGVEYFLRIAPDAVPCHLLAFMCERMWPEDGIKAAHSRFEKQFGVKVSTMRFAETLASEFPLTSERMIDEEKIPESSAWVRSNRPKK